MPLVQTFCLKSVSVCLHCQQHIWQSWRRHVTSASSALPDSQGLMTWKDTQSLYIWAWLPVWVCVVFGPVCTWYIFMHLQMHFFVYLWAYLDVSVPLLSFQVIVCLRACVCVYVRLCWCICANNGLGPFLQCSESPSASGPVVLPASRVIRTGHADQ